MEGCVGILDNFKRKNAERAPVVIPESFKAEDPVNYNTVLDFLVGLDGPDFKKMTRSAEIYRKANKEVADLIGVEDKPTTSIQTAKSEIEDVDLDNFLSADKDDLTAAFLEDEAPGDDAKPKKAQATAKKIEIED